MSKMTRETVFFSLSDDEKLNEISRYLIDAGIELDQHDNHRVTPLMTACRVGNEKTTYRNGSKWTDSCNLTQ